MYEHPVLQQGFQLFKEVLRADGEIITVNFLLGILGMIDGMVWATNILLAELPDGIIYDQPILQQGFQLLKEALCATSTITLLLGVLGAILLRKSLLGRQGSDHIDR